MKNWIEGIFAAIVVAWLGWVSWEIVEGKADSQDTIDITRLEGKVDVEIERSKILDSRGEEMDAKQWQYISDLKDRVKALEIKEGLHNHGS